MNFLQQHLPFTDQIRSDRNLKDLLRNSGLMYAAGGISVALTLLQQLTTAKGIGVENYGRFAAITATSTLLLLIVDFRTWEASSKLLARSFADNNHAESASTITWLTLVDAATGLAATGVLIVLAEPIARLMLHASELATLVYMYALLIPLRLTARGVPNTLIRLYGRFDWLSLKSIVYALLRLILLSGPAMMGMGLSGVIVGAILSEFLHTLLLYTMSIKLWRRNTGWASFIRFIRPRRFNESLRLMRDLWIGATLKGLQLETFVPLLALLTDPTQVGLYRVGLDIAQLVSRLMEPFSVVIQPTLIQLYEEQPLWRFIRYIKQATAIGFVIVIPVVLGVVLLGPFVFPRVLSETYAGVAPIASILTIGYGLNAVVLWLRPAIVALDAVQAQNVISSVALVLSLLSLIIIAPYGALGAAMVMTVFLITYALASIILFTRFLSNEKAKATQQ